MRIHVLTLATLLIILGPLSGQAHAQRDRETFYRSDEVASGKSITYYFGPDAPEGGIALSDETIFEGESDGAQMIVSGGTWTFHVPCAEGRNTIEVFGGPRRERSLGAYTSSINCSAVPEELTVANDSSVTINVSFIASMEGGIVIPHGGPPVAEGPPTEERNVPNTLPETGAGGMAGGELSIWAVAATLSLLGLAGFTVLGWR